MSISPNTAIKTAVFHSERLGKPNYALRRFVAGVVVVGAAGASWAGGDLVVSNLRRVDPGINLSKLPTTSVTVGFLQGPSQVVAEVDPKAEEHLQQEADLENIVLAQARTHNSAGQLELAVGQTVNVPIVPSDQ